jgi:hypothetical protein
MRQGKWNLACRMGLHAWKPIAYLANVVTRRVCNRCGQAEKLDGIRWVEWETEEQEEEGF